MFVLSVFLVALFAHIAGLIETVLHVFAVLTTAFQDSVASDGASVAFAVMFEGISVPRELFSHYPNAGSGFMPALSNGLNSTPRDEPAAGEAGAGDDSFVELVVTRNGEYVSRNMFEGPPNAGCEADPDPTNNADTALPDETVATKTGDPKRVADRFV